MTMPNVAICRGRMPGEDERNSPFSTAPAAVFELFGMRHGAVKDWIAYSLLKGHSASATGRQRDGPSCASGGNDG